MYSACSFSISSWSRFFTASSKSFFFAASAAALSVTGTVVSAGVAPASGVATIGSGSVSGFAAGAATGLDVRYHLIDVAGASAEVIARILDGVRLIGFAGINVTFPYKQAVIPFLDALDPGARSAVWTTPALR